MKSARRGTRTSVVEVTNVSKNGFWILLDERELFADFKQFPWFRNATLDEIFDVTWPSPHHLYWPGLDIDLAVESLEAPERFPLVSRQAPNRRAKVKSPTRTARRRD